MPNCILLITVRLPSLMLTPGWFTAARRKRTLAAGLLPPMQLLQLFCPGTIITGPLPPEFPGGGPQDGVSGEMGAKPGSLPPEPEGGPQDGVSGEMGAKPGSLPSEPEGGPQDGVSGEMGAKPGSLPSEPEGGPQDGVSGEMGAKPGSLSWGAASAIRIWFGAFWAGRAGLNPSFLIYIGFPFCSIADANGMIYPMQHKACRVKKTDKSG